MDESAAPFGESDTKRSARKKNFELPTGSPADFFTYISPRLALSKIQLIRWGSNNHSSKQLCHPAASAQTVSL